MKDACYKLILVTHRQEIPVPDYLQFIKICAQAGVSAVQLRAKQESYDALLSFGKKLKKVLEPFHIPLIINDHLDLAIALDAEGLHLGQSDGSPQAARQGLGSVKTIGLSIETEEQLLKARNQPVDYLGIGAIFPTANKQDVARVWGLKALAKIASQSPHPLVAIGGIDENNAADVMSTGVQGLAVIGAIHQSLNPALTIKNLLGIIDKKGNKS